MGQCLPTMVVSGRKWRWFSQTFRLRQMPGTRPQVHVCPGMKPTSSCLWATVSRGRKYCCFSRTLNRTRRTGSLNRKEGRRGDVRRTAVVSTLVLTVYWLESFHWIRRGLSFVVYRRWQATWMSLGGSLFIGFAVRHLPIVSCFTVYL